MRTFEKGRPAVRHLSSLYLSHQSPRHSENGDVRYRLVETGNNKYWIEQIKQARESTIYDFLLSAIEGLPPVLPKDVHTPYCLQEDIAMLIELSAIPAFTQAAFAQLAKSNRLNRPRWSLWYRYEDLVVKLREKDIDLICSWVERFGPFGFAKFEGERFLLSFFDEPSLKPGEETQDEDLMQRETAIEEKDLKYRNIKHGLFDDLESLNTIITIYASMVRKPIKLLLELLHQASGDFCDLDYYLETNDRRVLWTDEEDKALHFQISGNAELSIYRTPEGIAKRKRYLGIS